MKWNDHGESVAVSAERHSAAPLALPNPITNDVLLNRFKTGLQPKLQDQGVLVTGDFDTVVSSVSRLFTAQQGMCKEQVREVSEGSKILASGRGPKFSKEKAG